MKAEEFEEVFERVIGQSRAVLVEKAKEYAGDGDRLHNFKKASATEGITPEQALWGFILKHWVSLSDMVKSGEVHPQGKWDEKIGDMLNYLILLQAIIEERGDQDSTEYPLAAIRVAQTVNIINNYHSDQEQ